MHTLKKVVITLALLIPFSISLPIMARLSLHLPLPTLFFIQSAEAYTYQDVENAYNNAKTQYPNDKIWIEEVEGGYRLWRRENKTLYKTKLIFRGSVRTGTNFSGPISDCSGVTNQTVYADSGYIGYTSLDTVHYYCDGKVNTVTNTPPMFFGVSDPCWASTLNHRSFSGCSDKDFLIQEFIPVDLCLDKTTGNYVPCLQNCKDPVTGAPAVEICGNGIDDNCNGEIDEGCIQCQDNDGDGYYAYDPTNCPEGNDCNDNDPAINPATIWYKDVDGDGYSDGTTSSGCERPDGYKLASELTATSGDCDDTNASKNPEDLDGDGYNGCTDCKDNDPDIHPGATEKCDGKDNNCNGDIDEGACDPCLELRLNSSANAANGNLSHSQELFTSRGTGLSISMTLYYNSLYSNSGHIGTGWSHSYDITLKEFPDGSILFREGNDRRLYVFSNGSYVNQAGDYSTLIKNTDGSYILTKKDGTKYYFDTGQRLTKIEDRLGNTMTFVYTGDTLTEITDSVGRKTTLTYDSSNRITQIQAPSPLVGEGGGEGKTSTLIYNSLGYPTEVTDSTGYNWTYTYDATGRMLTKSDTEGNLVTYAYDSTGRVISSTDASGKSKTISYSSPLVGEGGVRGETTVTERDGGIWSYTYDASNGTLTQKTDPQGNTTTYLYDSNKNLINETASDGSITSYTYDAQGNMTSVTDATGNITNYTYNDYGQTPSIKDPQNNVTYYSYDTYGNLTSVTDLSGGITQFNYDSKGNITRITSPNGGITVYEYDSYNNLTKITDPSGNTTSFTYDLSGNMTSMTDSQENTTRFEYNSLNQLIRAIDSSGNITEYSYDSRGNKTSQTDANGNTTYYEYNHNNKLTKVTDALNSATTYTYGGTGGCPGCSTSPPFDKGGAGGVTSITDAKGQITTYEYDTLGRLTKETDPLGNSIAYSYDSKGNLISKIDANGNTINYTYDSLGRLLKKKYPDNTEETFTYDSKGNIITASNKNISYTFTYDAAGKVTNVTDSYGRVIKYQYEVSGNKTSMITPEGKIIKYNYDVNHRLTQITTDSVIASETKQSHKKGSSDVTQSFSFAYDTMGRRTKLTYPNGVTTNYTYDSIGRLTNLLTQYTELQSQGKKKPPILKLHAINSFTYTHDKIGNRLSKAETDKKYDYSYDAIYRLLQSLPTKLQGKDKEQENKAELFTYDLVGNRLTGSKDKLNYSYNHGNQLTELMREKNDEAEKKTQYSYDKNGNLVKKDELDDDGNIKKTILYSYDYENRLVMVVKQDEDETKTVSFKYDSFGRRIEKRVEEIEEGKSKAKIYTYVYDNEDILLEYLTKLEDGKSKIETTRYVHGLGIDELFAIERKGEVYYYHADGLGSITSLTDKKQKVVESYEYDSFGNIKRKGDKVKNIFTYTGREWDKEIELYYYRARYYDPKVGRFISKDPFPGYLDNPQTLNPYQYTLNAPINWIDPYGYLTWGERAFTAFMFAFRVFSPVPGYVEGLGVIKPIPVVGPVLDVLFTPSTLGNPILGPDGKWYYPDGTPVNPTLPPTEPCGKK